MINMPLIIKTKPNILLCLRAVLLSVLSIVLLVVSAPLFAQMPPSSSLDTQLLEQPDDLRLPLDSALPNNIDESFDFEKQAGVFGSITSIGSDTLATLVSLWAEQFQRIYPHVKFQIQASGSATAAQALVQGTASIGPMSRALTPIDIQRFTRRYGYPPTSLIVAIDAMAIYVEKNNPLAELNLQQIDAIFSMTRFCGGKENIRRWQQLGIGKFGDTRNIQRFGRNSA